MKKQFLFYIIIFTFSALTLSAIFPYPIFSNYTNINQLEAFEINNYQETEIKNEYTIYPEILDIEFEIINQILPEKFEIIDIETEQSFFAVRVGGNNHVDITFDKSNLSVLHDICENWSWTRRPVLVKINENSYLPASIICYPHGYQNHFCLHFKNSKTHGTNREDSQAQKAIDRAYKDGKKIVESN